MSQSLANVIVHLVFSTKDRQPSLRNTALREAAWAYLGEISSRLGCPTLVTGGTEDHIHLLARLSRSLDMAEWVKELK
ncbi:MAG TPA: transposase, partial [Verrucomicrobiales bacterium]|nr:transposase [Verrucomicrobiales bacterium]